MKKAFAAWMWSLGVVARSYRTVVVLAALIALWVFAAYEWLGLPAESSALLLILWRSSGPLCQTPCRQRHRGGNNCGCGGSGSHCRHEFPGVMPSGRWGERRIGTTLIFCLVSLMRRLALQHRL